MEPRPAAINATTTLKVVICHTTVMYNHYLSIHTPFLLSFLLLIYIKGGLDWMAWRGFYLFTFYTLCLRESARQEWPTGMIVCDV